jgi:hypothetical protein
LQGKTIIEEILLNYPKTLIAGLCVIFFLLEGVQVAGDNGFPSEFTLTSNAENPDDDGFFVLSWTTAEGALGYMIYVTDSPDNGIHDGAILLVTIDSPYVTVYHVDGFENGIFYFFVLANNENGTTQSNTVMIIIGEPEAPVPTTHTPLIDKSELLFFLTRSLIVYGIIIGGCVFFVMFKKLRKKR